MIYYNLLVLILFLYVLLYAKEQYTNYRVKNYHTLIITVLLSLLAGLRGGEIGRDTDQYTYLFHRMGRLIDLESAFNFTTMEPGYVLLQYYVYQLGFSHQSFFIICSALILAPVGFIYSKYSKNPWIAFFVFITFPVYTTIAFSAIRQGLAVGFVLIAFHYSQQGRLLKYLFFILIAFTFHTTALFFLPIFWLNKIKFSNKVVAVSVIAIFLGQLLKFAMLSFFNNYTRLVYTADDEGGQLMYFFYIGLLIFTLKYREFLDGKYQDNKIYVYMLIITVVIWPMCSVNPALFRLTFYFTIFVPLYITNFFTSIKSKKIGLLATVIVMIGGLLVFEKIVKNPAALNYPYQFYWEDNN